MTACCMLHLSVRAARRRFRANAQDDKHGARRVLIPHRPDHGTASDGFLPSQRATERGTVGATLCAHSVIG